MPLLCPHCGGALETRVEDRDVPDVLDRAAHEARQLVHKIHVQTTSAISIPCELMIADAFRVAVAAELEACARIVEDRMNPESSDDYEKGMRLWLAAAIRANPPTPETPPHLARHSNEAKPGPMPTIGSADPSGTHESP